LNSTCTDAGQGKGEWLRGLGYVGTWGEPGCETGDEHGCQSSAPRKARFERGRVHDALDLRLAPEVGSRGDQEDNTSESCHDFSPPI
jgi:hypothetical protein